MKKLILSALLLTTATNFAYAENGTGKSANNRKLKCTLVNSRLPDQDELLIKNKDVKILNSKGYSVISEDDDATERGYIDKFKSTPLPMLIINNEIADIRIRIIASNVSVFPYVDITNTLTQNLLNLDSPIQVGIAFYQIKNEATSNFKFGGEIEMTQTDLNLNSPKLVTNTDKFSSGREFLKSYIANESLMKRLSISVMGFSRKTLEKIILRKIETGKYFSIEFNSNLTDKEISENENNFEFMILSTYTEKLILEKNGISNIMSKLATVLPACVE